MMKYSNPEADDFTAREQTLELCAPIEFILHVDDGDAEIDPQRICVDDAEEAHNCEHVPLLRE